jgi:hypothetical protein
MIRKISTNIGETKKENYTLVIFILRDPDGIASNQLREDFSRIYSVKSLIFRH